MSTDGTNYLDALVTKLKSAAAPFRDTLNELHAKYKDVREGTVADYIPELAKADPKLPLGSGPEINAQADIQWRFLQNVRTAQGKFTPRDLAFGAPPYCGGGGMHAYKVPNWLDVPLPKTK